ncbi:uncharacterized protein VTP21DRAFT_5206 [Calcarisporiella thermophila]|uniref:uncharacterized protein n=1 Tax=Calcarisporiella thermophila TaxID=911321 RepID=UPI00374426C5
MPFQPFTFQYILHGITLDDPSASPPTPQQGISRFTRRPHSGSGQSSSNASRNLLSTSPKTGRLVGWNVGGQNSSPQVSVETVEAWENNLYIGTTDGHVLHYVLEERISPESNIPKSRLVEKLNLGFGKKIVERISLLPQISKAVVLCDSSISFYSLPDFEPLPTANYPIIRGITFFCYDVSREGETEPDGSVRICAIKRRVIHFYRVNQGLFMERELSLPDGAIYAAWYGSHICLADYHHYLIVDVPAGRAVRLDVPHPSTVTTEGRGMLKPQIAVVGEGEFLVASALGDRSIFGIGMFVSVTGNATSRGTLHFSSYPRSLCVEYPYAIALLRTGVIEISNIINQERLQEIHLSAGDCRGVSLSLGMKMWVAVLSERLRTRRLNAADHAGSDQVSKLATLTARLLIYGRDSIMALVATPLVVQVDNMLDEGRLEEALVLADQAASTLPPDRQQSTRMMHELEFIYQKTGLIYFGETLFDDASTLLEKGNIDPRVLISLFPEVAIPAVERELEEMELYEGVHEALRNLGSVNQIIEKSVSKMSSDDDSNAVKELATVLRTNAYEMLIKFLSRARSRLRRRPALTGDVLTAIDTALVRIYAICQMDTELYSMLERKNSCRIEDCEPVLTAHKKYYALSVLYLSQHHYAEALDIWTKILSSELHDPGFSNGMERLVEMLANLEDREELVEKYMWWVMEREPSEGIKLFTLPNPNHVSMKFDVDEVLSRLDKYGQEYVRTYLEYLIWKRHSQMDAHHTRIALLYIDDVSSSFGLDTTNRLQEFAQDFAERSVASCSIPPVAASPPPSPPPSSPSPGTFLSAVAERVETDILCRNRSKLLDFLQCSELYDTEAILARLLESCHGELKAEIAIVYGKLRIHDKALRILVDELKDFLGAEAYCLNNGQVIGQIEKSRLLVRSENSKKTAARKSGVEKNRRELFMMLLRAYLAMPNLVLMVSQTMRLLSRQAIYLDVLEVLKILPDFISVEMLSEFLVRSLRKHLHEHRQLRILKSLSFGENLMVSHDLYRIYEDRGPVVITEDTVCTVCQQVIADSVFKRLPNNDILHLHCSRN